VADLLPQAVVASFSLRIFSHPLGCDYIWLWRHLESKSSAYGRKQSSRTPKITLTGAATSDHRMSQLDTADVGATGRSPIQIDLSIYNILGQKVATLVSGKQKAGFHSVEWNASDFSSGVYYYQLLVDDPSASSGQVYREVKKMILIK